MKHMLISPLQFSGLFQSLEIVKFGLDAEPYLPRFHADPDSIRPLFYLPRIKIIDIVMPEPAILLTERRSLIVVYQTVYIRGILALYIYSFFLVDQSTYEFVPDLVFPVGTFLLGLPFVRVYWRYHL